MINPLGIKAPWSGAAEATSIVVVADCAIQPVA